MSRKDDGRGRPERGGFDEGRRPARGGRDERSSPANASFPDRRRFAVDPDLYPFEDRWLRRDGAALHYLDVGSGAPVLLLHGNPTWSFLYRDVIRDLEGACRCIAPDYPGFGLSDHPAGYGYTPREHAGWVTALVDDLELDRLVLVGQDWGGPIGLSVALERPRRVAGLLLCNTWCWPPDPWMWLFSVAMGGRPLGRWLQLRLNFFARVLMRAGITRPDRRRPEVLAAYRAPFPTPRSRMGTWIFPRSIRTQADWLASLDRRLQELRHLPAELLWAMNDPAFGFERVLDRWRERFPGARVRRLADAGHYLQEDAPERVADGIRRLLSRL